MSDIFLSYDSEDRKTAGGLAKALVAEGWSVFWDRAIKAGDDFTKVIDEELADARCILVLWSTSSIESTWVKEEAEEGRKHNNLIPVLIQKVKPPRGYRMLQADDLMGWNGQSDAPKFAKLVADIKSKIGPPVLDAAP